MMAIIGADIQAAAAYLQNSEVVAIPTETVYGLAGNALDTKAVTKIFTVKNRPSFDPLIVHTDTLDKIRNFVSHIPEQASQLAATFWPGPLTLLLPKTSIIPDLVTSGSDLVAVRIPNHPLTLQLLAALDFPLAAPSANPFGYISPTTAQHVAAQLGQAIPYILDGGASTVGIESTIVGFENGQAVVYRLGGISVESIEAVIGPVRVLAHSSSNPQAPGMLKSHYAPKKTFLLGNLDELLAQTGYTDVAVLAFDKPHPLVATEQQVVLSPSGNLSEAAQNLFAAMRALDNMPVSIIVSELLPNQGLGRAINDRLRRAAAKG